MVSRKRLREHHKKEDEKRLEAYKAVQQKAKIIFKKLYEFEQNKGPDLPANIQQLYKYAKAQTSAIYSSMVQKGYERFTFGEAGSLGEGDYCCDIAEDLVEVARAHKTNPQSVWQALSEQFPDVHFDVDWYDLASYIAATLREQHLIGVMTGMEIAGVTYPKTDPDLD
jgi:hypothetical protein